MLSLLRGATISFGGRLLRTWTSRFNMCDWQCNRKEVFQSVSDGTDGLSTAMRAKIMFIWV